MSDCKREVETLATTIISQTHSLDFTVKGDKDFTTHLLYDRMENAERLAILCRNQCCSLIDDPDVVTENIQEITGITGMRIEINDNGFFAMRVPFLLPKRDWKDRRYIDCMTIPALESFFMKNTWRAPNPCVIVFRYGYKNNTQMRDYDNMETKTLIDSILKGNARNDAPWNCSTYYCSIPADDWYTEIFVMNGQQFLDWLQDNDTSDSLG